MVDRQGMAAPLCACATARLFVSLYNRGLALDRTPGFSLDDNSMKRNYFTSQVSKSYCFNEMALEEALRSEQVKILYSSPVAIFFNLIVVSIVAAVLWHICPAWILFLWLALSRGTDRPQGSEILAPSLCLWLCCNGCPVGRVRCIGRPDYV